MYVINRDICILAIMLDLDLNQPVTYRQELDA